MEFIFASPQKSKLLRRPLIVLSIALSFLCWVSSYDGGISDAFAADTPQFVQEKDNQANFGRTASAAFSLPATAGNYIVAYLIWDNTGSASVSDTSGNTYVSAVGPSRWSSGSRYSAQIFYARNVRTSSNTITATFSTSVRSFGIIYAHEYSGIDPTSPIDVTAAAVGSSGSLNSGSVLTRNATDLLFAGGVSASVVTGSGAGYVARSTSNGNITEDRNVTTTGSYSATASNSSGAWAMQLVAFRASNSGPVATTPSVPTGLTANSISSSRINLSWNASSDPDGTPGQISYDCYRNGVRFTTTAAGTTACSDTGLSPSTTYTYAVRARDLAGNASALSPGVQATTMALPLPVIASFSASPASIIAGQSGTLSWSVSNSSSLTIDNGVGNVTGATSVSVHPSITTVYKLVATNSFGSSTAQASLTVTTESTPPTVPTGLSATVVSSSGINLSWNASTDPDNASSQISYGCFRNGVRFFTTAAGVTTCSDSGLTPSTTYTYSVSAQDPVGNSSAVSAGIQATTLAAPTPIIVSFGANPASIVAGQSSTLSWNVTNATSLNINNSVGNVSGATSVSVHPAATTTYQLTATNSFGSISASTVVTVSVDTQPPTTPGSVTATGISPSRIDISWVSSTDDVGISGYQVYRDGSQIAVVQSVSYSDTGLLAGTTHSYSITAFDAANNRSPQSSPISASTLAGDTQTPTVAISTPTNGQTISGTVAITADASDNVGITTVQFYLDGIKLGQAIAAAPYSMQWNSRQAQNGPHILSAVASDAAGNTTTSTGINVTANNASLRPYTTDFPLTEDPISEGGNWINGKTAGLDWADIKTTPGLAYGTQNGTRGYDDSVALLSGTWGPDQTVQGTVHSVNQNLNYFQEVELWLRGNISAHSITGYEINFRCTGNFNSGYMEIVRWNGPLSNFTYVDFTGPGSNGVKDGDIVKANITGNRITVWKNGVQIAQAIDNTYANGKPGIGFYLQGTTGVNKDYGFSSYTASDGSAPDTVPPSTPTTISAVGVSATQINLSWNASTDDVAVKGYRIFRNGVLVTSVASSTFSDIGLTDNTQYSYSVDAFDAANNFSLRSTAVAATTLPKDTVSPTAPSGLLSSNVKATSLTVSWAASSDNVGVSGYQVFRNGNLIGTTTSESFTDIGLLSSTMYVYTVKAYDSSNNLSPLSQQISVLTAAAAQSPPSFVQATQNQISNGTSVAATFPNATRAGNTIAVFVIWSNTGTVALSDSRGDTFSSASAPAAWGGGYSAQIFYATGIAGGTNTVTAVFRNSVSSFGVLYINEYSGIDTTNPIDLTSMATGTSASMNSGSISTTGANELIFGAGVSGNTVTGAGSGFVARSLAFGNIVEDRIAGSPGTYAATASQNGNVWAMQVVAFRPAN